LLKRPKRSGIGEIVIAWTTAGLLAGTATGGGYGLLIGLLIGLTSGHGAAIGLAALSAGGIGLIAGIVIGAPAGLVVGLFDGLVLAALRPFRRHASLIAGATTELVMLPAQFLLAQPTPVLGLLVAALPSVIGVAGAVNLARRLPPGRAGTLA
jgi:hypothetical protein